MASAVPTFPASLYHPMRADAVRQMRCVIASLTEAPAVLDFTRSGVLLEATARLPCGTEHVCRFSVDDRSISLPARVTHMRYQPPAGGRVLYQIGLAFRISSGEHRRALDCLTRLLGLKLLDA